MPEGDDLATDPDPVVTLVDDGACPEHPEYALRLYEVREESGWILARDPNPEIW